jgi:hypothetical protein
VTLIRLLGIAQASRPGPAGLPSLAGAGAPPPLEWMGGRAAQLGGEHAADTPASP